MKLKILLIVIFFAFVKQVDAVVSTPSPIQPESSPSAAIDQIRQAVREKVEARLDQIQDRPVGIIGQVTNITNQNITVLVDEQDFSITATSATNYLKIPGRSQLKREDIALQDYILVKGSLLNTKSTVSATEIQVIPEPKIPDRQAITGQITKQTTSEIQITSDDQIYPVKLTSSTPIRAFNDLNKTLKSTDLKLNSTITVVGTLSTTTKNQITPSYILLIP